MSARREAPLRSVFALSAREVLRNRFAVLLVFVIPAVFLGVTSWTSGNLVFPIRIFHGDSVSRVILRQKDVLFVYISSSVSGFLVAFFAAILFLENAASYRMAFVMGLSWKTFLAGRLAFLLCAIAVISAYILGIMALFATVRLPLGVLGGVFLLGVIYGLCGCIIGTLNRDFLTSILCILFLADLDAAWLQNPVYFATAQDTPIIRYFPAFYPIQSVLASAFEARVNARAVLLSLVYAAVLLVLFLAIFRLRFRRFIARKPGRA